MLKTGRFSQALSNLSKNGKDVDWRRSLHCYGTIRSDGQVWGRTDTWTGEHRLADWRNLGIHKPIRSPVCPQFRPEARDPSGAQLAKVIRWYTSAEVLKMATGDNAANTRADPQLTKLMAPALTGLV